MRNEWKKLKSNWSYIEESKISVTMEVGVKMGLITGRLAESLFKKQKKRRQLTSQNPCSHTRQLDYCLFSTLAEDERR